MTNGQEFYSSTPVDVFIPCALEQMITAKEAEDGSTPEVVAEGANAPTTPEGDAVLLAAAASRSCRRSCATPAA